jgi:hypothetical protein
MSVRLKRVDGSEIEISSQRVRAANAAEFLAISNDLIHHLTAEIEVGRE